jgi:hypothetical protein
LHKCFIEAVKPRFWQKVAYERVKKKHPGRNALPEHIPVEEIILEPEGLTPDMIHIGDEITETQDY